MRIKTSFLGRFFCKDYDSIVLSDKELLVVKDDIVIQRIGYDDICSFPEKQTNFSVQFFKYQNFKTLTGCEKGIFNHL